MNVMVGMAFFFGVKKSMMIDEELRSDLINSIIGSWRIEGLYLNSEVIVDMHSLSLGLIDIQQAVNNVIARLVD